MRLLILIFVTLTLLAAQRHASPNTANCTVEFEILNAGIPVTGIVEEVSANIYFDPRQIDKSIIVATAKPQSIRTGIGIRDKHLQRCDYFQSERYPDITLASKSFRKLGKNNFLGTFTLTIKGISKVIRIPFNIKRHKDGMIFTGKFEINRLHFALGEESLILDDTIKIFVTANTHQP